MKTTQRSNMRVRTVQDVSGVERLLVVLERVVQEGGAVTNLVVLVQHGTGQQRKDAGQKSGALRSEASECRHGGCEQEGESR